MRRSDDYERTAPRAQQELGHDDGGGDYVPAARAALSALPALPREAEVADATTLVRYLGQALTEAEGIVRRGT